MSHYIATCPAGELRWARIVKHGTGTLYSSPSAASAAIARYAGPDVLSIVPVEPVRSPGRPAEMRDGKRRNIYIDDSHWERAVELGDGNASSGVRIALDNIP